MSGKHFEMVFMPRVTVDRDVFLGTFPGYSAAIDGIVPGPSEFREADPGVRDPRLRGPKAIFDHHAGCVREATMCAAKQINRAMRYGLMEAFKRCGHPYVIAYAKDPDDDVAWSMYQLRHPTHIDRRRLKEVVELVDLLDTVNGFYPVRKRWRLLKMNVWVMEPYAEARMSGDLRRMNAEQMRALMETIHGRMSKLMYGRHKESEPDDDYRPLERYGNFAVIEEAGRYARYKLAKEGVTSFLSISRGAKGRYKYIIARKSPYIVDRPILLDYDVLNALEGKTKKGDTWGGSNLGGGSPEESDSRLRPEKVVEALLANTERVRDRSCSKHP